MEAALPLFEQAAVKLQARPAVRIPGLYLHLADSLAHVGRVAEAERAFLEELRYFPDSLPARLRFAAFYRAVGRQDAFVRLLEDLVRAAPSPQTYAVAVRALQQGGEPERARALARQGRAVFPADRRLAALAR
jgi:hypothetical protein